MNSDQELLEFWRRHKWTIILAALALIFAVCVISYGFFKALFIFICLAIGVYIGMRLDKRKSPHRDSEDLFRND